MSTGKIIAACLFIAAIALAWFLLFSGLVQVDGGLTLIFYGMPCSLLLMLGGFCLFVLSPSKRPPKHQMTCPACGYNMRGLTEARCPECGAEFTLDQLKLK